MGKICDDFSVFNDIHNQLYPYQREGVAWMWQLYKMKKGGVLGDDMGLGKTFQVIAFLSGMIDANLVKHVLILMPVSLIPNWEKEFKRWCPGISVRYFHGHSKEKRSGNLWRVQREGHVLLTSYNMLATNLDQLTQLAGRKFVWDYVILDEGHKIKNPTKTTKAVHDIPSRNRLVLTGTPIQNNLKELWSLYDFVQKGALLGSLKMFKVQFENPITRAREKDANVVEKQLGAQMSEHLRYLIKPYFLRRTKDEVWGKKGLPCNLNQSGIEKLNISKMNVKKKDIILWTYMSEPQIEIYQSFLHSAAVKSILVSTRSPLVELNVLKKICDHPRLLTKTACLQLGLDGVQNDLPQEVDESNEASSIDNVSDETLLQESGKLKLVIELVHNLRDTGHRTLIFSLSRKILDMIHRILTFRQWKVLRIDGTISRIEERERRIQLFQNDPSYPVFLLTTQVGGVGITLTAADRVIIYDPSWNPATDAQAVDRAYRIGQQKDIVVYRMITCGTVEEKIYRRQIFKDSITRQATGAESDPHRYFSNQELKELFIFDNPRFSATQVQLTEMHSSEQNTNLDLEKHIQYLSTLNIFGISYHDLMFTREEQDPIEDSDKREMPMDYMDQVAISQQLDQERAAMAEEIMSFFGGMYNQPYQEHVPVSKKSALKDTYKPPFIPEVIDLSDDDEDVLYVEKPIASSPAIDCIDLTDGHELLNESPNSATTSVAIEQAHCSKDGNNYLPSKDVDVVILDDDFDEDNDEFCSYGLVPSEAETLSELPEYQDLQENCETNLSLMMSDGLDEGSLYDELIPQDAPDAQEETCSAAIYNQQYQEPVPLPENSELKDIYKPPLTPNMVDLTEDDWDVPYINPPVASPLPIDCIDLTDLPALPNESQNGGTADSGFMSPKTSSQVFGTSAEVNQAHCSKMHNGDLENCQSSIIQKSATFILESDEDDSSLPTLERMVHLVKKINDPNLGDSCNAASANKALAATPTQHMPNFLPETAGAGVPEEFFSTNFCTQDHCYIKRSLSTDSDSSTEMPPKRPNLLSLDSNKSYDKSGAETEIAR